MTLRAPNWTCSLLALAILLAFPAWADNDKLFPAEAAIPNSRVIRFTSAIDGEPYTIEVSIPLWPPPKAGYPVLYVLDGELYFPTAAIESDQLGDSGAVVVGIGHDTFNDKAVIARYANLKPGQAVDANAALDAFTNLRNHDFRWPARPEHRAPSFLEAILGPPGDDGGLDAFLSVIEKEIKPKVEALVPIDKNNQVLFGHSAGGLAVVHALFTEPGAFRTFIAASPALWYDGGAVFAGEKQFAAQVTKRFVAPRVLITVGALEPDRPSPPHEFIAHFPPAQQAEITSYFKMRDTWPGMISGSRRLAKELKALPGKPGYKVDYQLLGGEVHATAAFVAVDRAIRFAFLDK